MGWMMMGDAKYWKHGRNGEVVDRRRELDDMFTWNWVGPNGEQRTGEVLKSTMVGSVYYAAVRIDGKMVSGMVCKTCGKARGALWGYKEMDETMGPYEDKCPATILALLTPTENAYANEWRERCRANISKAAEERRNGPAPIYAPTGVEITTEGRAWVITSREYMAKTKYRGCRFTKVRWHSTDNALRAFLNAYGTKEQKAEYAESGRECPTDWKEVTAA